MAHQEEQLVRMGEAVEASQLHAYNLSLIRQPPLHHRRHDVLWFVG